MSLGSSVSRISNQEDAIVTLNVARDIAPIFEFPRVLHARKITVCFGDSIFHRNAVERVLHAHIYIHERTHTHIHTHLRARRTALQHFPAVKSLFPNFTTSQTLYVWLQGEANFFSTYSFAKRFREAPLTFQSNAPRKHLHNRYVTKFQHESSAYACCERSRRKSER